MRLPTSARATVLAACATVALIATAAGAPAALAAKPHHHHAQPPTATPYAFRAVGYGTRVRGGQLPASSGTTSYQGIGCTNRLGTTKENQIATAELPSLGRVDGVLSTTGTTGSGDDVSSYSTHDIASLSLAVPNVLGLQVKAIHASSTASHDASGYHATTEVQVGHITLTVPGLPAVDVPIPKPGAPTQVPGLLTISMSKEKQISGMGGAIAKAEGLVIQVLPTNTKVQVAHTGAMLSEGVKRGLFFGKANGTQVKALGETVRSGPQPLEVMPCQGTDGHERTKSLAAVTVPGVLQVDAASTAVNGDQSRKKAAGYTTAAVGHADVLNGTLVVDSIRARAHVVRTRHDVKADSDGTSIGSVLVNGQPLPPAALDGYSIPGVLTVATNVTTRKASGIDVVGVRITLLDGSGAVIDLAHAMLTISGSGLHD
jgi:hypothetical protein